MERRKCFVEAFFGYEIIEKAKKAKKASGGPGDGENALDPLDMEILVTETQVGGLGWMEDVWTTVLRPLVCEVHVDRVKSNWPELSGVMHATYPESAMPEELTSFKEIGANVVWDEGMRQDGSAPILNPVESA